MKNLPLIHSYDSIQALSQNISKSERKHDLVIAVSCFLLCLLTVGHENFLCLGHTCPVVLTKSK